jgi:hypothetical protein
MNRSMRFHLAGLCAASVAAWALLARPVRADTIDENLAPKAAEVMEHLQKQGYKNVGVLHFRVEMPGAKSPFGVGRLNSLMATRLENVLILANDDDRPIGITRAASERAAARDKKATYLTAEGRKKLFAEKYPLAWGDKDVTVDAFLTGLVKMSPDLAKATVTIEEWLPGKDRANTLAQFEVPTNRLLLADLNRNFILSKRSLNKGLKIEEPDPDAVASAAGGGGPVRIPKAPPPTDDDTFDGLLDFRAHYGNEEFKPGADNRLPAPRDGQEVYFTVEAKKERLGVVVLVNGVNTLGEEGVDREPDQYSMWVLEPGKRYTIRGYYTMENAKNAAEAGKRKSYMRRFEVLSESESLLAELGDPNKRGKIELILFRQPDGELPAVGVRAANMRSVTGRLPSLQDLKSRILMLGTAKVARGILAPPGPRPDKQLTLRALDFNGVLAGYRSITYYEKPGDR